MFIPSIDRPHHSYVFHTILPQSLVSKQEQAEVKILVPLVGEPESLNLMLEIPARVTAAGP